MGGRGTFWGVFLLHLPTNRSTSTHHLTHCLTFVSKHRHTTLHLYIQYSSSPTSSLSFDTTLSSRPPPFPSQFLTKFDILNITIPNNTATPFLLKLPSLSPQAPGWLHTEILHTLQLPAVTTTASLPRRTSICKSTRKVDLLALTIRFLLTAP
jgi:hypothetical protein